MAVAEMKRAVELDPVSPVGHAALGFMLNMSRDFEGAQKANLKAIELQPDLLVARLNLANTYIRIGEFRTAQSVLEKLNRSEPQVASQLIYLYAASGRTEEAARMMPEIMRAYNEGQISSYDLAVLYAAMDQKDEAFETLAQSTRQVFTAAKMRFDPQLDALRNHERFSEILRQPSAFRASK
jgi:Flp pilus assembly protein TadD